MYLTIHAFVSEGGINQIVEGVSLILKGLALVSKGFTSLIVTALSFAGINLSQDLATVIYIMILGSFGVLLFKALREQAKPIIYLIILTIIVTIAYSIFP